MDITGIIIIVTILLATIAGLAYLLIRNLKKNKRKETIYDYTTKYGTRIMLSPQTKNMSVDVFEAWSDDVVTFWHENMGWDVEKCFEKLSQTEIEIFDSEYLERNGFKASGLMWPSSFLIEISTFPKGEDVASTERIASLFRHETSHIMAGYVGNLPVGPNGGEYHHKLFAEIGLGA